MSDMVERVAKAMADAGYIDGPETLRKYAFDGLPDDAKGYWRRKASAAIEAMREPTPDMMKAVFPLPGNGAEGSLSYRIAWERLIDAALAPNPDEN